jgi:acetate kinase
LAPGTSGKIAELYSFVTILQQRREIADVVQELTMDSAQHCLDQSAECRRLMKQAQSEAEERALKVIARSWLGLAGQIDRYNTLMREQRRVVHGQGRFAKLRRIESDSSSDEHSIPFDPDKLRRPA